MMLQLVAGANLGLDQKESLIYPLSVLSTAPSMFKSSSAEEMEWVPLFFSETSGRYFYFGENREILFIMPFYCCICMVNHEK